MFFGVFRPPKNPRFWQNTVLEIGSKIFHFFWPLFLKNHTFFCHFCDPTFETLYMAKYSLFGSKMGSKKHLFFDLFFEPKMAIFETPKSPFFDPILQNCVLPILLSVCNVYIQITTFSWPVQRVPKKGCFLGCFLAKKWSKKGHFWPFLSPFWPLFDPFLRHYFSEYPSNHRLNITQVVPKWCQNGVPTFWLTTWVPQIWGGPK